MLARNVAQERHFQVFNRVGDVPCKLTFFHSYFDKDSSLSPSKYPLAMFQFTRIATSRENMPFNFGRDIFRQCRRPTCSLLFTSAASALPPCSVSWLISRAMCVQLLVRNNCPDEMLQNVEHQMTWYYHINWLPLGAILPQCFVWGALDWVVFFL